jgi:hypothetical protein
MPRGSGGGVFASTRSESEAFTMECCESVTVAWNMKIPIWSVVPERIPVSVASDNPLGRVPEETCQEYGRTPPVATNEALYSVSAVAGDNVSAAMPSCTTLEFERVFELLAVDSPQLVAMTRDTSKATKEKTLVIARC